MKKLLSILICVVLGITSVCAQQKKGQITIKATTNPYGKGTVQVKTTQAKKAGYLQGWTQWYAEVSHTAGDESSGTAYAMYHKTGLTSISTYTTGIKYTVVATDKADSGYSFSHWESTKLPDHNNVTTSSINGTTDYLESGSVQYDVVAVFKSIIASTTSTMDIVKTADTKTDFFSATLYNAANFDIAVTKDGVTSNDLTCEIVEVDGTATTTADAKTTVAAGEHDVKFEVVAQAGAQKGDVFIITLTATNGAKHTVTVTIFETLSITFRVPTVGKGSYTYVRDSDQDTKTFANNGQDSTITMDNAEKYTLTASPAEGYRFNKWTFTKKDDVYGESTYIYTSLDEDEISAEFIEDKYAMFMVKGKDGVYYNDLNRAIAATGGAGVVLVYKSGYLAAGNYTIPSGVTLLIPGDEAYTVRDGALLDADVSDWVTPTCFRELILEDNTSITVDNGGSIFIYAKLSTNQGSNGAPVKHGKLTMNRNCHITLLSGAKFSAFGYVVGDPTTSSIIAQSGSFVYESFNFIDWRGGTATFGGVDGLEILKDNGGMVNNPQKVFPVGQYYVQNIETSLILNYGAIEYISSVAGAAGINKVLTPKFISNVASDGSATEGFLNLGPNTKLTKYYDKTTDRQKYVVEGLTNDAKVAISYIYLSVTIPINEVVSYIPGSITKTLDSRAYVLPVTNNIDFALQNVDMTIPNDISLLGDVTVDIDANSTMFVEKNLFVYDKEESQALWYSGSTGNATIRPVKYTPSKSQYLLTASGAYISSKDATHIKDANLNKAAAGNLYKRQVYDITTQSSDIEMKDATINVNGKLIVNGYLYTTASGANITSDGGGKVEFKQADSNIDGTELYRYLQAEEKVSDTETLGIGYHAIPVTNAKLHNDETLNPTEPYSAGSDQIAGKTYTYVKSLGKWLLPQTLAIASYDNEEFNLTLPQDTTQNVICQVNTADMSIRAGNFEVTYPTGGQFAKAGNISYDATTKQLTIPIKYAHRNIHNVGNPYTQQLVVKCKDLTSGAILHTEEIDLIAIEDYKPKFSVSIDGALYMGDSILMSSNTYVNATTSKSVVITAESDNVAKTLTAWTKTNENPFDFVFGAQTEQPFAAAQLTYTPTINGEHKGSVSVTATYTDREGHKEDSTVVIKLKANAILNANTLEFAQFPQPIYTTTDAFELIDNATKNNTKDIDVTLSKTGIVNITGTGTVDNPYKVTPLAVGVVTITATQAASGSVHGKTISTTITVLDGNSYPVPFCINEESGISEFNKRLYGGTSVSFNETNSTVEFNSTSSASEWIFRFKGTPDKLTFTPTGNNLWNVQQRSSETAEWKNIVTWTSLTSGTPVSYQLEPTTCQIRIQYGSANAEIGTLADVCVSELLIAANVNKLYIPIHADSTVERTFVLTHTQGAVPTIALESGLAYSAEISDNLGTAGAPYYKTTVKVATTTNTTEKEYTLTATEDGTTVEVIVSAYTFPQELPIKLATDAPANGDRYYFVTSASSNVQWDAANRQVILQNPGAQLPRTITFAFNGAPSVIRFDAYSAMGEEMIVDSVWVIEESVDGKNFYPATLARDSVESNKLVQELKYTTRFVRIKYNPEWLREVRLSNLVIEGYPQAIVYPDNLFFTKDEPKKELYMIAINLQEVDFEIDNPAAFQMSIDTTKVDGWKSVINASENTHPTALGTNKVDTVFLWVKWNPQTALDEGKLIITNKSDNDSVLAVIPLLGSDSYITIDKAKNTGISTGIPDGNTYHGNVYTAYKHHAVELTNAFATDGTALFDYLFIYGETTPDSGTDITIPQRGNASGSTNIGSNAVTPLFVYKKALNADNQYKGYQFVDKVENVNVAEKAVVGDVIKKDTAGVIYINVENKALRVYMTGFAPYATTGYDKLQEGVFLFRGTHGAKLDVYLEDFHVSSRNKTKNGNAFYGDKEGGEIYSDGYARGSGGVLVFENVDAQEQLQNFIPFEVNIHTRGNNLLNSNHGCFYAVVAMGQTAMKAYQVSSPIQVHMFTKEHVRKTKTTLNFDDIWPTSIDANNAIVDSYHTNGFLALKKQANNAPSIDMGNQYTEVNFKGGQVELQNSQIGSDTYKTTLAISYRAGFFGAEEAGIQLCHGIGTDAVDGTVNFLDGTITVEPMWVKEEYKQYYLIDVDANGNEITRLNQGKTEYQTTCLRTPKNTFVRGGSICRVRACQNVTSKGGGPKDISNGEYLGQYVYVIQPTDKLYENGLVEKITFPNNIEGLKDYHDSRDYSYGLNSVTPDVNNKLYFWIPEGYGDVTVEKDVFMATWKACMTKIGAGLAGVAEGEIGGDTEISSDEEVQNFLYCQLDDNIYNVISAGVEDADGNKTYTYKAPIEVPAAARNFFKGDYTRWAPNLVGPAKQHEVTSETNYTIANRIYYITTATADIWQTFTAPFDVENIYVVETYSETELEKVGTRSEILVEQANHNADFAAFFGVAMAMGSMKDFDGIYDSYIKWAKLEDDSLGLWNGQGTYTLRGKTKLIPYIGKNWREANFYLNHNNGNWDMTIKEDSLRTKWEVLKQSDIDDGILLHKGETYSLMFPYCTGCEFEFSQRTYWDYWSGKFLIFESTAAPQTISGRDFLDDTKSGNIFAEIPSGDEVIVTGNSTFSYLTTNKSNVYRYADGYPSMGIEGFVPVTEETTIYPANAFLYGELPTSPSGMPARKVTREGKIIYDVDNDGDGTTTGGGNIPTVGGGNDLFITSTVEGINIAVAEPQHVRVLSSTGAVLYSGMVQTAVDVALPTTGVYVITGENEVHKILH